MHTISCLCKLQQTHFVKKILKSSQQEKSWIYFSFKMFFPPIPRDFIFSCEGGIYYTNLYKSVFINLKGAIRRPMLLDVVYHSASCQTSLRIYPKQNNMIFNKHVECQTDSGFHSYLQSGIPDRNIFRIFPLIFPQVYKQLFFCWIWIL